MRLHRLKTLETYFELSRRGLKPYEIRQNDRLYQRGDIVELYCIKKSTRGDVSIRTKTHVWAPWPVDSNSKQPLSLDMFETDFLNSLERITATVDFVLPGTDEIGMYSDHVILSLRHNDYNGPLDPWMQGLWKPTSPSLFDAKEEDSIKEPTIKDPKPVKDDRPIPPFIYWHEDATDFCHANGKFLSNSFYHEWKDRRKEFPRYATDVDAILDKPKEKKTKDDETKLLKEATPAPELSAEVTKEGEAGPVSYKPKGFA